VSQVGQWDNISIELNIDVMRFQLEKYRGPSTRYTCPECGKKKEFTRYIDIDTGNYIADHVGKCNREINCGYHYTPKQYFEENKLSRCPVPDR
jgi:rubredoxin